MTTTSDGLHCQVISITAQVVGGRLLIRRRLQAQVADGARPGDLMAS